MFEDNERTAKYDKFTHHTMIHDISGSLFGMLDSPQAVGLCWKFEYNQWTFES